MPSTMASDSNQLSVENGVERLPHARIVATGMLGPTPSLWLMFLRVMEDDEVMAEQARKQSFTGELNSSSPHDRLMQLCNAVHAWHDVCMAARRGRRTVEGIPKSNQIGAWRALQAGG